MSWWRNTCVSRNECLFFWVNGEWIGERDKQIAWTAKRFLRDLFVLRSDSFPMNPEKRHSFLIFTMFPTKVIFKILREKFKIPTGTGTVLSFDVIITAKWFAQLPNYLLTVVHPELNRKFWHGSTKEIYNYWSVYLWHKYMNWSMLNHNFNETNSSTDLRLVHCRCID